MCPPSGADVIALPDICADSAASAPLDRFVARGGDIAARDAQDLMAWPFFSLAKAKRVRPIDFTMGSVSILVEATAEHGMATIWDADILIWIASQIVEARDAGRATSRLIAARPHEILAFTRRGTGKASYERLKAALRPGDHALIEPPPHLAKLLARRGYLPVGVPLVKRVAAIEGQLVCRRRGRISIDGAFIGTALAQDRRGRALPRWAGCRRLGRGEVFLMNPAAPASFDGRYFGALPSASLIGRAVPLWTDKASTDRPSMRGAPMTQPLLTTSARKENLP